MTDSKIARICAASRLGVSSTHREMEAMIVLFPPSKSRRIAARRPRRSKNGTPEERAAKKAAQNAQIVSLPGQTAFAEKRGAMVARAEQIVALLGTCHVIEGWRLNEQRAALFLENMRTFDERNGDDPRFTEILAWVGDHGQSLDWIFAADPSSLICGAAAQSKAARGPVLVESN